MNQPCPDDMAPLVAKATDPAKWIIVGLVAAVIGYELLALLFGWKTISQYTQAKSAKYPWVKWTLLASLSVLVWHLVPRRTPLRMPMMMNEPRVSMFRQWSEARKAQLLQSLKCPTCGQKDLPEQKPLLDLVEDGTAYCNNCGGTWRPEAA